MLVKTYCAAVNGLDVTTVTIEVSLTKGVMFRMTGLGDTAVREGRDRMAAALVNNGYLFPNADITVNMAPADLRKEGSGFDLPLAIGVLAASKQIEPVGLDRIMLVGELGLDGALQPVKGALPIAMRAKADGFVALVVPQQNVREAAVVEGIRVYGMSQMKEVISMITGQERFQPVSVDTRKEFYDQQYSTELDYADVRGQQQVKRALEVAAAGGHNLITREISIGDYVLTGGELAAAVMADAIVRIVPGVIGDEQSALSDCFQDDMLSAPIYTRPADYKGWKVPDILLSGNEAKIKNWEMEQAMERTKRLRPDLLK